MRAIIADGSKTKYNYMHVCFARFVCKVLAAAFVADAERLARRCKK